MKIKGVNLAIMAVCLGLALVAGAEPWLLPGLALAWLSTLWLQRELPVHSGKAARDHFASLDKIAQFLGPINTPILLLREGRIVAANRAAQASFGSHILDQDARIALRHPDAIALLDMPDGSSVSVAGLTDPKSQWTLEISQVDDRHRLIELTDLSAMADVARAHTDFVANASHELRTPLAAILGYLEVLSDPAAKVDGKARSRFLTIMSREALRMQSLITDLMSLSRIEAEKHDVPDTQLDLAALVKSVAKDTASVHGKKRVTVHVSAKAAHVKGDRSQIEQLIRNLVDNAIKYGAADAPVSVDLSDAGDGNLALAIADTGPGIPADQLPHLTRRFYRTDPGRSREEGGTGLGLAIVKHIAERHRARLDIHSVVGEGTRVTITFRGADGQLS